jgi:hypothetical protein
MSRTADPAIPAELPRHAWHDVVEGLAGAAVMVAAFLTPFLRRARSCWGTDASISSRAMLGDDLVVEPRWEWTHGVEIEAPAAEVWPWVAQIGADRGGFYSYQWLENLVGCGVHNAETVHPEWAVAPGDALVLHPKMPPFPVVAVDPGHAFAVHAGPEADVDLAHDRWADCSWSFLVEPLGERRSRVLSRYRCATSDDLVTRLQLGPTLVEPVSFAMDRRMLLGIKQRAERGANREIAAQPMEVTR